MAREVALCGSECFHVNVCRCTFSITTIASSTTRPVASVIPNSVSELMEKPKILMNAKVPISETGMVIAGIMVARQSCRNRKMTMMTMTIASLSVIHHFADRVADNRGRSRPRIAYSSPGGKDFASSCERRLGIAVHVERIGVRKLLHADADGVLPVCTSKVGRAVVSAPSSARPTSFSSTMPDCVDS